MKKQVKKTRKIETKQIDKTKALKWVIIGVGIAAIALWISWFISDCIFVADGIKIDDLLATPAAWHWNKQLFRIQETQAIVLLGMTGAFMGLLFAYTIICGLNIKNNLKPNLYRIITSAAGLIAILICVVKAAEMMINQKYVIDILFYATSPEMTTFNVYHLDFLKWMSIPPGAIIFSGIVIWRSFEEWRQEVLIRDSNILILVYAILVVGLFVPFVIAFGFNDVQPTFLEVVESKITWRHITAQCITSPMGVFAGMLMVLMVVRIICVIFAYNNRWAEKKQHIIIFSIIGFFVFVGFIVSHVNPLDFAKLILDYDSMKVGGLLVVLAEAATCLPAGVYCLISHINYERGAK